MRPFIAFAGLLICAGCESSAGTVVKDIRYASDGRLVITRCYLVLTYTPLAYVPNVHLRECIDGPPEPPLLAVPLTPSR
jgi:hypothetical protein